MSDERDPKTGSFDPDEWFRTQFGAPPPASSEPVDLPPPVAPPVALPPPVTPSPPVARPPPVVPPVAQSAPVVPPPPAVEPAQTEFVQLEAEPTIAIPATDQADRPVGDAATELMRAPEEGGALDELFATERFEEVDAALIPAAPRASRRAAASPDEEQADGSGGKPPRPPLTKNQKVLLWIAGGLAALLVLVGLFFVGTRIPDLLGPAPGAEPSPTPTPTPTSTSAERPVGPVPPGEYWWDELWGGECLEPFVDAWQDEYTVVDCGVPHGGQLVARLPFPLPEGATEQGPYPGEEVLAGQIAILCSAPGVIDLAAAGAFSDIQIQGAFAVSEEQWDDGVNDYFCFVSRSSGEVLTGSLAIPPPAPATETEPDPAG